MPQITTPSTPTTVFPTTCLTCHTTDTWSGTTFDHATSANGFDLVGAHEALLCESCHVLPGLDLIFNPADQDDCLTCHESDFTTEHADDNYPTTCLTCHTTEVWTDFDHATVTNGYDLVGAHAPLDCSSCHTLPSLDLIFTPTDQDDCVACHASDYNTEHADDGFPTTCLTCHTTDTWSGTTFDHATLTNGFDLVGAHEALLCESCHVLPGLDLIFNPADQDDCLTCHESDYSTEHADDGFPTTCLTCHTTEVWTDFDHATVTNGYDLVGAHAPLDCSSCHTLPSLDLIFTPTDQDDCVACHASDYNTEHADDGFPTTCLTCHTTDTWSGTTFDHATLTNGFDLVGAHEALLCESCHVLPGLDLIFNPADQDDCLTCHESDYSTEHADDGFPTTCLTCHTTEVWTDFDHATVTNGYDLVGAHAPLDCSSCHTLPSLDLIFTPTDQDDCVACHASDYNTEHADDGFPTTCLTCHTTDTWSGTTFDHGASANGFDLVGAHEALLCESCHVLPGLDLIFNPADQDDCLTCHESDFTTEHADDNYPTTCLTCHTTEVWTGFDHATVTNGYDLVGAHEPLACESCHNLPSLDVLFTPTDQDDCVACHESDYQDEHVDDGFPTTCLTCHTTDTWSGTTFDHATSANGYDLVGAHEALLCESCHVLPGLDLIFNPADQDDCLTCHESDYTTEHADDNFPTTCLTCHTTEVWTDFDHATVTNGYDLVGAHEPLLCESCHTLPSLDLIFTPTDQDDCVACHASDYNTEHADDGFPTTCLTCHNTNAWDDAEDFNHESASNGYDLVGAHEALLCESCHVLPGLDLIFNPADQDDCLTCHESDYSTEHADDGFPTTCLTCHTTEVWTDFDHATVTNGYDLVGAHEPLDCSSCHTLPSLDLIFTPTDQDDCVACHASDYNTEHADDGFPTTCLTCHTTETWSGTTFDHGASANGFDLVGAHEALLCESCHVLPGLDLIFNPADQDDCVSCHASDYNTEHADDGFPTTCLTCHTTEVWTDFDHATVTNGYDLVGAHEPLLCESCHTLPSLDVLFTPTDQNDCLTCHESDYTSEHSDDGFPTTCLTCHTTETWSGTTFDHATSANGFDLVGAHEALLCESCHVLPGLDLIFNPADQDDCIACHQTDFQTEHSDDNFPTTCLTCHTTEVWTDFDHATVTNGYDLVGAHAPLACESCHVLPSLNLIFNPADESDCIACHQDDYQGEHGGSGTPTTCLDCHTTIDWEDITFDHDQSFFPIFSGRHQGEWSTCLDCHTNPDNFQIFSCLTCHEHNKPDMDEDHDEVPGYVYDSAFCYDCHPNGESSDN